MAAATGTSGGSMTAHLALTLTLAAGCSSREAFFTSDGEPALADVLVSEIDASVESVDVAIYTFTHEGIGNAMENAALRGAVVRVLGDEGQYWDPGNGMQATFTRLAQSGVEVRLTGGLSAGGIMHHKFAVLDGRTVLTGSFNFTDFANTLHHENLLLLADPAVASEYSRVFTELWDLADAP